MHGTFVAGCEGGRGGGWEAVALVGFICARKTFMGSPISLPRHMTVGCSSSARCRIWANHLLADPGKEGLWGLISPPPLPHKITSNARAQCFLPIAEASMRSGTTTYKYHQQPKNSVNYCRLCTSIAMSRKLPMLMTFHFLHFMVSFPFLFLIWKPDVALIQPSPRDVPIITSLWSLLEYVQAFTKLA